MMQDVSETEMNDVEGGALPLALVAAVLIYAAVRGLADGAAASASECECQCQIN